MVDIERKELPGKEFELLVSMLNYRSVGNLMLPLSYDYSAERGWLVERNLQMQRMTRESKAKTGDENHRWYYLTILAERGLVERQKTAFPRGSRRGKKFLYVCRIKPDRKAAAKLVNIFYDRKDMHTFFESDYYKDQIWPEVALMLMWDKYVAPRVTRMTKMPPKSARKKLFDEHFHMSMKLKLPSHSPSFVHALYNSTVPYNLPKFLKGISFQEFLLSFYIYDFVNEKDEERKEALKASIEIIKHKEAA